MASGSLVTVPPAAWAAGAAVAAVPVDAAAGRKEEAAVVPRNLVGCDPRQQQQQERNNFVLSYSETGLPVLLPSCGSAGFSPSLSSSFSGTAAAAGAVAPPPPSPYEFSSSVLPFPYAPAVASAPGGSLSAFFPAAVVTPPPLPRTPHGYWGFPYPPAAAAASHRSRAVSTGTTIVAVTFKNGVVLGADTRTSAGSYVVNRAARKITPVHEKICVCRSGSAADTQALTQIVKLYLQQYAQELPRRSTAAERRKHEQRVTAAAEKQQRQAAEQQRQEEREREREREQQEKRREAAQEEEDEPRKDDPSAPGDGSSAAAKKLREQQEEDSSRRGGGLPPAEGGRGVAADETGAAAGDTQKQESPEEGSPEEESDQEKMFAAEDARAEPRVRAAATLFQSLCYEYKETLTAGLIVAGYDAVEGSQIYSIPLGGAMMPMKCTAGGSGSGYISAFMDAQYHPEMERAAAVDFVKKCVAHAISRDGSSGGMIRIIVVTKHGLEEEFVEGNRLPVRP